MYINRKLEKPLNEALRQFPAILITGARQTGKSTLLKHFLKNYKYVSLDDLLIRNLASTDPALFIKTYTPPIIIDEIQYAPDLFSYIKIEIDNNRKSYGQYVLTGSQVFSLMSNVSESLAGRIAIFNLFPFSWTELQNINLYDEKAILEQTLKGFYPEFQINKKLNKQLWHSSYLSTYVEKDLRAFRNIKNLDQFERFLVLLAARCGQLLNLTEISKECSISQTTAKDWLNLLKATFLVYTLEPYHKNITKRIVKSPKLYFVDTGILCYLLRINTIDQLMTSPFRGHIFENMVIMDKIKNFLQNGKRPFCYFYRTMSGSEIDLIIDEGKPQAYEIKFTSTPKIEMTKTLESFKKEHKIEKAYLLNLRKENLPFSNGIEAIHWSN